MKKVLSVVLLLLITLMASCSSKSGKDRYASIFDAIEKDDLNAVKLFIAENPRIISEVNQKGMLPLHAAAHRGKIKVVQLILMRQNDINREVIPSGDYFDELAGMPIHIAASRGHVSVIDELLKKGADINARESTTEYTPLHKAVIQGHTNVVKYLLDHGADPNLRSSMSFTALHEAVRKDRVEVIKLLVERGVNINEKDRWGQTPLSLALTFKKMKSAEELRKLGALEVMPEDCTTAARK